MGFNAFVVIVLGVFTFSKVNQEGFSQRKSRYQHN
jgi:hypothetical protein